MQLEKFLIILILAEFLLFSIYNKYFSKYIFYDYLNGEVLKKEGERYVCISKYKIEEEYYKRYYYVYVVKSGKYRVICVSFFRVSRGKYLCLKLSKNECLIEKVKGLFIT